MNEDMYKRIRDIWTAAGVEDHSDPKSFEAAQRADPERYAEALKLVTAIRNGEA